MNHLRGYLDFAERGVQALTPITLGEGEPESPFEQSVIDVVRSWGYRVEPQVGHAGYRIDMAIRHPETRDGGCWESNVMEGRTTRAISPETGIDSVKKCLKASAGPFIGFGDQVGTTIVMVRSNVYA